MAESNTCMPWKPDLQVHYPRTFFRCCYIYTCVIPHMHSFASLTSRCVTPCLNVRSCFIRALSHTHMPCKPGQQVRLPTPTTTHSHT